MSTTALAPVKAVKSLSNTVTFGKVNMSVLLTAEHTGGVFSLVENVMRPGTEPPYHVHEREDETFYVLEGQLGVMVDGEVHEVKAGEAIFLPRGVPHTFRVRSEIVRGLGVITPSGFEKFFQTIGKPAVSMEPPSEFASVPGYFETVGRVSASFGVRLMPEQPQF